MYGECRDTRFSISICCRDMMGNRLQFNVYNATFWIIREKNIYFLYFKINILNIFTPSSKPDGVGVYFTYLKLYIFHSILLKLIGQSWHSGIKCDCKTDWLWVRSPRRWNIYLNLYFHFFALWTRQSAVLPSAIQHAMPWQKVGNGAS